MDCEISVIVPVYNAEEYLDRCIKSILNQTFINFELILINDGSTDKSLDICNKYCIKDSRIRLVNQENKGVSFSRNIGIEMAKGKFILFIDSDDYIDYDMIEYLYNMINDYNAEVAICKCKLYIDGNLKNQVENENIITYYKTNREIVEAFMIEKKFLFSPCNKLYKKSIFIENQIKFPINIKYGEDAILNYNIFMNIDSAVFGNIQKYNYYINDSSSTKQLNESKLDILVGMEEIYSIVNSKYPDYTYVVSNAYITSSIGIVREIAKVNSISRKNNILNQIKILLRKNKYIADNNNLSTKDKILYSIIKISPIILAMLYKINFIIKERHMNNENQ